MLSLRKLLLYVATLLVALYCVSVLYHVQSAWDLGLRGLFATVTGSAADGGGTAVGWSEDAIAAVGEGPHRGDLVLRVAGHDVGNALQLQQRVDEASPDLSPAEPTHVDNVAELDRLPPDVAVA